MMMTEIAVVLVGLALFVAFVWPVLFTPVEEDQLAGRRAARREGLPPERHRLGRLRLLGEPHRR
jgi:hypothetical protein